MSSSVALDADRQDLRAVARRYLETHATSARVRELIDDPAGYDPESWREISELGWPGIAVAEEDGGVGLGFVERCLLMEEMGRVLLPSPYLASAVLAADALAAAGTPAARALLAELAAGTTRATLVVGKELTLDASTADVLLVAADGGLFRARPRDATIAPVRLVDETRRFATVTFAAPPSDRLDAGGFALEDVLLRGAVSLAAEMIGSAQRAFEITVAYVKERHQFGVPIGSFQALKHRLADLHVKLDAAREVVYAAADAAGSAEFDSIASAAKVAANEAGMLAAEETIQLHGGIGFTSEHDAHLFYKRALVCAELLGSTTMHLDRMATGLGI